MSGRAARGAAAVRLAWLALVCLPFPPPAGADPLAVVEVAPGVFVHPGVHEDFTPGNAGGHANLAFIVGETAVAVVDSGGSRRQGERLLEAIRERTELPVRWVVNTHVHPDHVLGNAAFRAEGTVFVGHRKLPGAMARAGPYYLNNMRRLLGDAFAGTELVPPTLLVADRMELELGGRRLHLRAWPTAHTDNDLTVLDERTGTLLAGDLMFMERIPIVDGSLNGWLRVLDELELVAATRVVPGHGPAAAPWPEALAPQRRYLGSLRERVRAVIAVGGTMEQAVEAVAPDERDAWRLVPDNHPRNVISSYRELEWE